jgi:sterol desaturase/sphingolipid hydroxylase (fatty acid hydroxylase superfamily)
MDWLAPNRRHPIDMAIARLSVIVPMAVLGFPVVTVGAHFAVKRFQGLFVHANLRLDAGPLTWLVATPQFHHWHHADQPEAYNKNYAGELPIVDWLFGTLYLPRPAWPERYGCDVTLPASYLGQLAWPFRSLRSNADEGSNVHLGTVASWH